MTRTRARLLLVLILLSSAVVIGVVPAAAQRLPDVARPEHYTLWFAPDLQAATFRGRETIRLQITKPTPVLTLHAAEITFGQVRVTAGGRTQEAKVTLHPESETASLAVPDALPPGPASLEITYTGILNDKLRGFYLSKANNRAYAVSQMEATDARRAFPSFDEPAFKATFDVSLMIDRGDTAISNGAQTSDTPGPEPGKHTVTFATTKKMSTYLVALLVGDFVCRESKSDGIPVRVCSTPDKKALTGFALEAAVQQLAFYNDYYGIRYPFGKLDIVGIPDFAAGAMENWGAITFREQYLLADPKRASLETKKTVASILSHEIAHQWFGNLVTMQWWDDIWLNEGFATWMANKPLAAWRPDWHVELDDVIATQEAASLDALRSTRAIRTKVETPEEINEVFDAIAYEKSAAVLRMVEAYLGPDVFRKGVASYLKKYSYANAAAEDFWTEVTRVSGKPVDRIMASYVDQPGVPVLKVAARCHGSATEITVQQERFIGTSTSSSSGEQKRAQTGAQSLPPAQAPTQAQTQAQTWTVPVCTKAAKAGAARCEVVSSAQQTFTVPGCAGDTFLNAGSVGYFLTEYPPDTVRALSGKATSALSPAERVGFLGDEWWMVRAGRHDIGPLLDLTAALSRDTTPAVTDTLVTPLAYTADDLVQDADRPRFQQWVQAKFGPALQEMGLPGRGDDEQQQSRRATLLDLVGRYGDARDLQQRAGELAAKYIAAAGGTAAAPKARAAGTSASKPDGGKADVATPDAERTGAGAARTDAAKSDTARSGTADAPAAALLPGSLAPAVLRVAAYGGDAALYDRYVARLKTLASEPEEYYRYFEALPFFRDPALIARTLALAMSPDVRSQDTGTLIAGVLVRPWGRDAAWAFITREWPRITARLGTFQGIPTIIGATGAFCSAEHAAAVREFFAAHPVPSAERTLQQAIERIDSCVALKARQAPAVHAWLNASGSR